MNTLDLTHMHFKGILQNSREYTGILHNTHESTEKTINSSDIRFRENFRIYRYIQEYTWIPQICGYAFKEILQNSREYKRMLNNAHESTG